MNDGRLLITNYKNGILTLGIKHNQLEQANFNHFANNQCNVGDIIIGKVITVLKNMNAAFVEISPGNNCFLPLSQNCNYQVLNRVPDGRLHVGDHILVQIEKDKIKSKDAVITTNITLVGKYAFVSKENRKIGYSNKIRKQKKEQIKIFLMNQKLLSITQTENGTLKLGEDYGFVIRTSVQQLEETSFENVIEEIHRLGQQLNDIITKSSMRTCYQIIHKAPPKYMTFLKELDVNHYEKIVTDNRDIWQECHQYLKEFYPEDVSKLDFYEDQQLSLFQLYSIEQKLSQVTNKKVWLKSGGYLVIEPTEALIVIDVNSGKFDKKVSKEEAIFQINMEAASEIVHQLIARNLSGIIIIDFINMNSPHFRQLLIEKLKSLIYLDRIKTDFIDITPLGLVELTRMKKEKSLQEQLAIANE